MKLFALLAAAVSAEFNPQPTNGQRVCEFYNLKAKAIFDLGFTEDVPSAMADGQTKVRIFFHIVCTLFKTSGFTY